MPVSRYLCIFINVGLGEAAALAVGSGVNRLPGGYIVQFG
ncbi:gp53-like domain-containing protein, partial [Escherichia coli]